VSGKFHPFKEKSPFLSSQAALFFSFAKESRSHDTGHCCFYTNDSEFFGFLFESVKLLYSRPATPGAVEFF
jgi:hypothetical protein